MTAPQITCYVRQCDTILPPEAWLSRVEDAESHPLAVLKAGGMKNTLKVNLPPWGELCLNAFYWDMRRKLLSAFRISRGARIWACAGDLLKNGVRIPEPVFLLEIRRPPFVTRTYIAYPWLSDRRDLGQIVTRHPGDSFFSILQMATDTIARLHNAGFIHKDLKWGNIACASGPTPRIIIGDLDGIRRTTSAIRHGKDFARFILDAMRFRVSPDRTEVLIRRYLDRRNASRKILAKSIRYRIALKKGKYIRSELAN
ncbi:hypothetical protein DENIS_2594 [Desulfonema ishimotonii]|uniref:Protein kinase domain-containing protein n=1 Tax=Desulfonema ishimotonii TaxID=45657 RepID=A0A401FXA2_9BACT|nr:hypothetical protein [Desulfonema ishimotonii]GBC61632.1 hypothetical protein DENIS_2594 [Desulfonema ishimotonii]